MELGPYELRHHRRNIYGTKRGAKGTDRSTAWCPALWFGCQRAPWTFTACLDQVQTCHRTSLARKYSQRLTSAYHNFILPNMPDPLNPLRPPSSPGMFQRFLRRPSPRERSQLSSRHTGGLNSCITTTRKEIFQLEQHIKSLNANILTIRRCIKHKQPSFTPPIAVRLPEIFQIEAVPSPVSCSPKGPRKWSSIPLLRSESPPNETKEQNPASLIEQPTEVPEAEREIPSPTGIDSEDMPLMVDGKAKLQVQFNLLVLKQAELEVEVQKLEGNLLFWGDVYRQVRSVHRQETKKGEKRMSYYQTRRPSQPSLLRGTSSTSDLTSSEYTEDRGIDTSTKFKIPRKEVPIEEMIARFKAASLFSSEPGPGRKNSWTKGDDLFMTEGSGLSSVGTGSSSKLDARSHAKPDHKRDDSGVDMSADIERAKEDSRWT